jgi:hypothetical protein
LRDLENSVRCCGGLLEYDCLAVEDEDLTVLREIGNTDRATPWHIRTDINRCTVLCFFCRRCHTLQISLCMSISRFISVFTFIVRYLLE